MDSTKELFTKAANALQDGALCEASALLDTLLTEAPSFAPGLHLLGLVRFQDGEAEAALPLILRAVEIDPHPLFLGNLGTVYKALGRLQEAEAAYRRALALRPNMPKVQVSLGALLWSQKRLDEAEAVLAEAGNELTALYFKARILEERGAVEAAEETYRTILSTAPHFAEAQNDFGLLLRDSGRGAEAIGHFNAAMKAKPDFIDAAKNLGNLCVKLRLWDQAKDAFRSALQIMPDSPSLLRPLAALLLAEGGGEEAIEVCRKLVVLCPEDAAVFNDLGFALKDKPEESEAAFRRALDLAPQEPVILNNLAVLLSGLSRHDEAESLYRQALALKPDYVDARHNFALLLLQQGRFDEALPSFEARYDPGMTNLNAPKKPLLSLPLWEGEDIAGKTILVQGEQAFGDEINFVRFTAFLKEKGAKVWLVTRSPLVSLMRTVPWVDRVLTPDEVVEASVCDAWVFSLSLPLRMGMTLSTIPAPIPYVSPDPEKSAAWKAWLQARGGREALKVGLVWRGKPKPPGRSLNLAELSGLAARDGVDFVSLQVEPEALADSAAAGFRILDAGSRIKDFSDTASLMVHLDLVISIDSAPAHLAGALGVPVWVLLRTNPDWRWFLERSSSPWYPSMRLFRQEKSGQWAEPLAALQKAFLAWDGQKKG